MFRKNCVYGVSKALTSLQTNTESLGLLIIQAYVIAHTWTSYYHIPIDGFANIGETFFRLHSFRPKSLMNDID